MPKNIKTKTPKSEPKKVGANEWAYQVFQEIRAIADPEWAENQKKLSNPSGSVEPIEEKNSVE